METFSKMPITWARDRDLFALNGKADPIARYDLADAGK